MAGHDIAVVGGGLIGAAVAWGARRAGADVILLDEGDVAHRASRGNFGLIWLQGKGLGAPPYMRLSLRAGSLWPAFADAVEAASGQGIAFRQRGGFHFCFDEAGIDARRRVVAETEAAGGDIRIEILDRAEVVRRVPQVGPEVAGASFSPSDAVVNPLKLLRALVAAFVAAGGVYRPSSPVAGIVPGPDGFALSGDGFALSARRVVLAAGLGNARLAPMVGLHAPVTPERGQILVTERLAPFFPYAGNSVQQTDEGTVLVGSSHEHAGFSEATDVGAGARLARTAVRVFPGLASVRLVRQWAGLRVMSPDGRPIYEGSAAAPGAFLATCHSGVTLASLHGLELGPAIAAGTLPAFAADFGSARFHVPAA